MVVGILVGSMLDRDRRARTSSASDETPVDFGKVLVVLECSVLPVDVQACVAAFDAAGG